jgi:uncharacterized protein (TIGR02996 family)
MHPEADAFLDAIFDAPDDDTPRLVFADWLEEHDQENYARFIRLQCAAARERFWSDEANRLWEEIGRVWNRMDEDWFPATRDSWLTGHWASDVLDAIHFYRGFPPPNFAVADEQFLRFAQGEVWLPWILPPHCALLLTPGGNWKWLASHSALRRVAGLSLSNYGESWDDPDWIPDEIVGLLHSPHLANLQTLDLSELLLTRRTVTALLEVPNLSSVQRIFVELSRERGLDPTETIRLLEKRFKDVVWTNEWDSE